MFFSPKTNNFVFMPFLYHYIISKIQIMIYGQIHGYSELHIKEAYAYDIHTLDSKELYKALRTHTGTCEGTSSWDAQPHWNPLQDLYITVLARSSLGFLGSTHDVSLTAVFPLDLAPTAPHGHPNCQYKKCNTVSWKMRKVNRSHLWVQMWL